MCAAVGEQHLDLEGAVLDGGSEVLDRHEGQRRGRERPPAGITGARRESEFEPGHRRQPDQATLDTRVPSIPVGGVTGLHPHVGGRVDEPTRHRHAASIASGSSRSPNAAAERAQSAAVTEAPGCDGAPSSSLRRKNSLRDNPCADASASMRSTAAPLRPRMSTFGTLSTPSGDITISPKRRPDRCPRRSRAPRRCACPR